MQHEPAAQQRIVDAFRRAVADEADPPDHAPLLDPFQYVASANYVVPMLFDLAMKRGNEVVDHVPRYSSLDHSMIWSDLVACVARFETFAIPYFNSALVADPFAEELLGYEHNRLMRRHVVASFEQDMWTLVRDENGLRIRLAEPMRRSALHLIANEARHLRTPEPTLDMLRDPNRGSADLALASGTNDLKIFATSCPDAWARLQAGLPFPLDALPAFRAFVLTLGELEWRWWYHRAELWDAWGRFTRDRGLNSYDEATLYALVDFHSVTVDEARDWGVQGAFLRFGETFGLWLFVFHVLPPDLHFLVLLARRYESLWSRTLGADLELVADGLCSELALVDRVVCAPRRRRKGVGEADIVLLDPDTSHVVVCELKTVFDKFRTHLQMRNFTEQKVNFPKALGQAMTAAAAIADGRWPMRDLFGREAPSAPSGVTPVVLTWWDTYNPTLGSDAPIACCNFDTLLYVVREAGGDVAAAVQALAELAGVFCPGVLVEQDATVDGVQITMRREVQGDALPPPRRLAELPLCELARRLIADLPAWSDDDAEEATDEGFTRFIY